MIEEKFRLMILSRNGTGLKQISLSVHKFYIFTALFSLAVITMVAFSLGVFTKIYHNCRIIALENDRIHLQDELLTMKERVASLGTQLGKLEDTEEELRKVANLPPIDNDTRQVGTGGMIYYPALLSGGFYTNNINRSAEEINKDLDKFERVVLLEKASFSEIYAKLMRKMEEIDHFPSINPILGGRITDRFGYRIDPYTHKLNIHQGVDIPAYKGTSVLATADGIVKEAKLQYTPHKDYGREIIIDHGFGYETRYAHLSQIHVYKGQRVKRWEIVGEVGDTGKATGDHLHYEVIYDAERQDPEHYIYN